MNCIHMAFQVSLLVELLRTELTDESWLLAAFEPQVAREVTLMAVTLGAFHTEKLD